MDKKVIAILFGGASSEHEVSKLSAANIIAALDEDKYFVLPVYITRDGRWFLYDGAKDNIKNLQWEKFATTVVLSPDAAHHGILRLVGDKFKVMHVDAAFPVLHGKNGEDGTIQGLLELAGIPYVGSGVAASAICMDKAHTKTIASKIGLKQADYLVFDKDDIDNIREIDEKVLHNLSYPCFVKPASTGSSVGISKAANAEELAAALADAAKYDRKIIVEKAVAGREIECSVLGNEKPIASGVGEITYETEFYCYDAKYKSGTSRTIVPADLPQNVTEQIRQQSLAIYRATGCRGLARVDFFVDEAGDVIFNEINTMPGFTDISMYPMLWQADGMTYTQLVDKLIELAVE
ncbi:MAG: D-alanine--D-alanine ligase [Clostridiales bacterium]|jgi:D-alanine-D-alanine ligase|nr:D-alanine--D-alanine ligase [Clostridiales bacterium]